MGTGRWAGRSWAPILISICCLLDTGRQTDSRSPQLQTTYKSKPFLAQQSDIETGRWLAGHADSRQGRLGTISSWEAGNACLDAALRTLIIHHKIVSLASDLLFLLANQERIYSLSAQGTRHGISKNNHPSSQISTYSKTSGLGTLFGHFWPHQILTLPPLNISPAQERQLAFVLLNKLRNARRGQALQIRLWQGPEGCRRAPWAENFRCLSSLSKTMSFMLGKGW